VKNLNPVSALPPKANIDQHGRNVRFVAKSGHYAVQQLIALIGGMHCWMFASSWRGL
jgi:hypothetical protein